MKGRIGQKEKDRVVLNIHRSLEGWFAVCPVCLGEIRLTECLCLGEIRAGMVFECPCGRRWELVDRRGIKERWEWEEV